jgi:FtsP/CotA-like multicopper oxidase with cupredoxin domain
VLGAFAALGALLAGVAVVVAARWWDGAEVSTVGDLSFATPLAIPPLEEGELVDGTRVFELTARAGTTTFKPGGEPSPTAGYDASILGPTLRMRRGERVEVRVRNDLDEVTTTHWHGMSLPAVADGGPHSPIAPGETWTPTWSVDQPAATLWYHPHPHERTEHQVHRGMAGMVVVDEEGGPDERLPHDYGVDDVPVIVQDRAFDDEGRVEGREGPLTLTGRLGDELLVNGTWDPHLEVTTERVRLRLLNASTARSYAFALSDGRPLTLVGTDGGLLGSPVEVDRLPLSPGERAEVVVEVDPGSRVVLRSSPPDLGLNPLQERAEGGDDSFDVLELRAAARLAPSPEVPDDLAPAPDVPADEVVRTRSIGLDGTSSIDGRQMDLERIDAVARAGSVERWEVSGGGTAHSFHLHDVRFLVEAVDGAEPPAHLRGWKDTVFLPHGARVRLLVRFGPHSDDEVPYMFHCHLLRHEDQGMMGQVLVTDDGEGPDRVDAPPGHDHGG